MSGLDVALATTALRYVLKTDGGSVFVGLHMEIREEWVKALLDDHARLVAEIGRLTCPLCKGTGRKAVGEHETLTNEWVTDYADCDHAQEAA